MSATLDVLFLIRSLHLGGAERQLTLLALAMPPAQAAALLHEYAAATRGTKALKWSPGLKKRFSLDEVADEVLAEEAQDETTKLVTLVEADDWRHVLRHRSPPARPARQLCANLDHDATNHRRGCAGDAV